MESNDTPLSPQKGNRMEGEGIFSCTKGQGKRLRTLRTEENTGKKGGFLVDSCLKWCKCGTAYLNGGSTFYIGGRGVNPSPLTRTMGIGAILRNLRKTPFR